jgi:hypothetical protein
MILKLNFILLLLTHKNNEFKNINDYSSSSQSNFLKIYIFFNFLIFNF